MTTKKGMDLYFFIIILAGIGLRLVMPMRGYNQDVEAYRVVADIVAHGGNVYAETKRYNYGPIWFHILHVLDIFPWHGANKLIELRWKVASFLTMVDVGIFSMLFRLYGTRIAALFFLNPISIIITGYHSQFDNLAVFLGLVSVVIIESREKSFWVWIGLIVMGLSLSVKHILFLFPLWLAFKENRWSKKIFFVAIPYLVFLFGFLLYMPDGANGILKNVFLYRSGNNAPFWAVFAPGILYKIVPSFVLFIVTLLVLGLFWRHKKTIESLHLYLISLVVFSSAISTQYFSICIPSIATQWNWAYAVYTLVGSVFLLVVGHELHIAFLQNLLGWDGTEGDILLIVFLAFGLLIKSIGKQGIDLLVKYIKTTFAWLLEQIQCQIKAPW